MAEKFEIQVNDSFTFTCTNAETEKLDSQLSEENKFHLIHKDRSISAEIVASDFHQKKYSVRINGSTYKVAIKNSLDQLIDQLGLSVGNTTLVNDIKAPMPGIILEIAVQVGDEVEEGQPLLVLEAMKMENTLSAPRKATIKNISVNTGETVEKNQLLIEMD